MSNSTDSDRVRFFFSPLSTFFLGDDGRSDKTKEHRQPKRLESTRFLVSLPFFFQPIYSPGLDKAQLLSLAQEEALEPTIVAKRGRCR